MIGLYDTVVRMTAGLMHFIGTVVSIFKRLDIRGIISAEKLADSLRQDVVFLSDHCG